MDPVRAVDRVDWRGVLRPVRSLQLGVQDELGYRCGGLAYFRAVSFGQSHYG